MRALLPNMPESREREERRDDERGGAEPDADDALCATFSSCCCCCCCCCCWNNASLRTNTLGVATGEGLSASTLRMMRRGDICGDADGGLVDIVLKNIDLS